MANNRDEAGQHDFLAERLEAAGFAVLRFDFRGCGASGTRGWMRIGSEWPQDLDAALTYLQSRPEVDSARIGAVGSSWGGGVTIHVAAIDERVRCAASLGAPTGGESWLRSQWERVFGLPGWETFLAELETDRARRAAGQPTRYARLIGGVIPVPSDEISFYDEFLKEHPYIVADIPLEVIDDLMDFSPVDVVHQVAPTPLLLVHGEEDPVVDYQHAHAYFERAGDPKQLCLLAGGSHQVLSGETADQAAEVVLDWLERYLKSEGSYEGLS